MSGTEATGPADIAAGINQIEGHLLLRRERDEARDRARRFTDRLDWLTPAQRTEVERRYAEDQMAVTERTLRTVARRCEELRAEYQEVYRALRRRLLRACLLGGTVLAFIAFTAAVLAAR